MRILLIDVNCKKNSTGKIVYDLYHEYKKRGHTAAISFGRGPKIHEDNIIKHNNNLGVAFHALKTRITGNVGNGSIFATRKLIRYIENFKPDIIHLNTLHGYHVDMYKLLMYLKEKKYKVIYTLHDMCTHTGKCGHTFDCNGWQTGCGNCPQLKSYPKSIIFDKTAQEFKLKNDMFKDFDNLIFVSVSNWLKNEASKSRILKDKRHYVIHNGLDTSIFKPVSYDKIKNKWNIKNERIVLHVTPNFEDNLKGGEYVLELARRLEKENVKIFIVGNAGGIRAVPKNIILVGRTENQQELAAYYSIADICLLTSSKETFSMVTAESICCGTPVVGFEAGAPSEIAPEGYGKFVPYGNLELLQEKVESLLKKSKNYEKSKECSQFGKENYDKRVMADKYLKLYNLLVNEEKRC